MNLKGKMTIICGRNYQDRNVEIEVQDKLSSCRFLKIFIKPEDFIAMLGRLSSVEVDMEVYDVEKIGKKMIMKDFQFELPNIRNTYDKNLKEIAKAEAIKVCPKGWEPDNFYGSQTSFCEKNKKIYANTTIRKWIKEKKNDKS